MFSLLQVLAERSGAATITFVGESVFVGLDQVTAIGMVVAELVANSFGHAFPKGDGTVTIVLTRLGPARAQLTIRDDGMVSC
jgi:two-component sensor histidine kinase